VSTRERRRPTRALIAAGAGTALLTGYGAWEARRPRLRRARVAALPPGSPPLRILQISDLHMTPRQSWKVDFVRGLARLAPDLVVDCGDNLAHPDAVAAVLHAVEPLLAFPGVFVGGSNDYFAPRWKNPARYLLPDNGRRVLGAPLPWADLRDGLGRGGWLDATHRRHAVTVAGLRLAVAGVDDPHLQADRYDRIAGPVQSADLGIGVVHAPEPRVLDRFAADRFALILAGHTHGGQLRLPGVGALVTNCGLDPRLARGLASWDGAWLHVSAGLGTSPYAPVRLDCPPEATLLTVVPVQAGQAGGRAG
jgi:predicted MPP superfamily phosphohydrolase